MIGAVGETASMKRRKLWKTGEDGLCCSSSAIQTRLDPSSLLEGRSETPIVFCCFFCVVGYPPNWGKRPRYIDIDRYILYVCMHTYVCVCCACFFFMNGNTKRAKCALSRVCIP